MIKKNLGRAATVLALALVATLGALAAPAQATGDADSPLEQSVISKDCGTVTLQFVNNHEGHTYTWNVHANDGQNVLVPVSSEDSPFTHTVTVTEDSGSGWVSFGVVSGAESDYYLKFQTVGVETDCLPEPTSEPTQEPTPTPGPEPTQEPEPTEEPEPSATPVPSPSVTCVDVNTAGADRLRLLKHVDEERAAEIIKLRPFSSINDLDRVTGLRAGGTNLQQLVVGDDESPPLCPITTRTSGEGDGLPVTGASAGTMALVALILAGLGAFLFRAARRRRVRFTA